MTERLHNRRLGQGGEDRAARSYELAGYEIVDRNWRCREGEVDLIVRRSATLVFSEVKTRSGTGFGFPAESVTRPKQLRIRKLAAIYLASNPHPGDVRFDVVAVNGPQVEIIEAAF